MLSFHNFLLQPKTLTTLANMGITEPTPIQAEAIPALLAGNDLVGQSATGSGKTLAYGVPLVERLARDTRAVQALVLVPTRELAVQVNTVLSKLAADRRLSTALLVGGRPYNKQIAALRYGSQIIVGTPGRVKDHLDRGSLVLSQLRMCVLDEADQMLDIGFAPVIEEILATTPDTRQMALFSATIPDWIAKLQQKYLKNPIQVDITPAIGGQSTIEQIAYQVPQEQKIAALCTLLQSAEGESSLIFGRTKFGVEKLGQQLSKLGFIVGTLHGNKSQRAREDVLTAFRRGQLQTLLATNVAARGLDIQGIYQVINYELPESSELFTHRIGRTGRMGRQGKAITLLVPADVSKWRRMARSLGQVVALQRLAIDEEVMSSARTETRGMQKHEQENEPQPAHNSEQISPIQEPKQENEQRPTRTRKPLLPVQEHEQDNIQRPTRARKSFSREQEQGGFVRPKHRIRKTSDLPGHRKEVATNKKLVRASTRQSESPSKAAPPYAGQARNGKKGKLSGFESTSDRRHARAFAAAAPQHRGARKKSGAMTASRPSRTTKRPASR